MTVHLPQTFRGALRPGGGAAAAGVRPAPNDRLSIDKIEFHRPTGGGP